jgi:hypothetical protein
MKLCLALAVVVLCAGLLASTSRAQPAASDGSTKAAADLAFNRARERFDAWCKQLDEAHHRDSRDLRVVLRLADCWRLNGQLDEAKQLLDDAERELGAAALERAQLAADAELGGPPATSGPEVQWAEACRAFEESLRLDSSIAAQLAVAACHLRRGALAQAREQLTACTAALEPLASTDEFRRVQLRLAQALTAELERVQPRLLVSRPAGFSGSIAIDGNLAEGEVVPVDPGAHTVRATLDDARVEEATIELSPRAAHTVTVTRGPQRSRRRQLVFWGLIGGGAVATLSAGLWLWGMQTTAAALADREPGNRCSREGAFTLECDPGVDASTFETRATLFQVSAIGGGALLAAAAVVHFTAPKGERLRITPAVGGQAVGVTAMGRF